jgi:hypothetical protein
MYFFQIQIRYRYDEFHLYIDNFHILLQMNSFRIQIRYRNYQYEDFHIYNVHVHIRLQMYYSRIRNRDYRYEDFHFHIDNVHIFRSHNYYRYFTNQSLQ